MAMSNINLYLEMWNYHLENENYFHQFTSLVDLTQTLNEDLERGAILGKVTWTIILIHAKLFCK